MTAEDLGIPPEDYDIAFSAAREWMIREYRGGTTSSDDLAKGAVKIFQVKVSELSASRRKNPLYGLFRDELTSYCKAEASS